MQPDLLSGAAAEHRVAERAPEEAVAWAPRTPAFVPPLSFACVTAGIYRGGFPKLMFAPFLDHLELTAVVSITPEPLPAEITNRLSAARPGIRFVHIAGAAEQKKSKKKRGVPVTIEQVDEVLQMITDLALQPVYLHCMNGRQATSLIVACLRISQGWSTRSAFAEYARFCDYDRKDVLFVDEYADHLRGQAQGAAQDKDNGE